MSEAQALLDSRPAPTKFYRWLVLAFASLAMFGNYYFYDALEPLAKLLQDQLHFSAQNIGMLQAAYSFPNIFTVVLGGILIDRIGTRKAHAHLRHHLLHRLPHHRLRFHVSPDGLRTLRLWHGRRVAHRRHHHRVAKWFKGKELSFALGISLMIAPRRHVSGTEFAHLGQGRLQLLAKSMAPRRRLREPVRRWRHRLLHPRSARREAFLSGARRRAGQDRPRRRESLQSLLLVSRRTVRGLLLRHLPL